MLVYYSQKYTAVEADVTYYRVPSPRMVAAWERALPDNFRFCAKFPRSIVHAGKEREPDRESILNPEKTREDTESFLTAMRTLEHKCGPLILQFPYFNKNVFPDKDEFYDLLDRYLNSLPKNEFRYGIELRNMTWINDRLLQLLKAYKTALVFADIPYMPGPQEILKNPALITTDFAYIRLIGDRKLVESRSQEFNRIVVDQTSRLQSWAHLIQDYLSEVPEIFAFANNHFAGYGIETIDTLERMIRTDRTKMN